MCASQTIKMIMKKKMEEKKVRRLNLLLLQQIYIVAVFI